MIIGGTELIIEVVQEPVFGPLVVFGLAARRPRYSATMPRGWPR